MTADTMSGVEVSMPVTLEAVRSNPMVISYLEAADRQLEIIGYTEHGERHATLVATRGRDLLNSLSRFSRRGELAAISGYLHDLGNMINRDMHPQTGALLAQVILTEMGMPPDEVAIVMTAIGNHEEEDGKPISDVGAALILADKSDVHHSRVRSRDSLDSDIHDRVNFAAQNSSLTLSDDKRLVVLALTIDTNISSVMEYFKIFLPRMEISREAAEFLGCGFHFYINGEKMN